MKENYIRFDGTDHQKYREDLYLRVKETMAECAIRYVIGISGDANTEQRVSTEGIIEEFIASISDQGCAVLTGGTEGGVPQIGVETAKRLGVPTIGVFPKQGRKYALLGDLDLAVETTPPDIGEGVFGTETPTFVNILDGATVIGGSYGTLAEVATILKTNTKRIKDRAKNPESAIRPIYLAPIHGTGGVADITPLLAESLSVNTDNGMPDQPVTSGGAAARFILGKLRG